MSKKVFYVLLGIFVVALALSRYQHQNILSSPAFSTSAYPHVNLVIGSETFKALVADTEERKERGLSGFKGLDMHEAMLFPYDAPSVLPFWMKGMLFSIDMLWVSTDFHIVYFEKDASPDSYPKVFSPKASAQYVIELSAGTLDRLGVALGDAVSISSQE